MDSGVEGEYVSYNEAFRRAVGGPPWVRTVAVLCTTEPKPHAGRWTATMMTVAVLWT